MLENKEIIVNNQRFYITVGMNKYESTEYLQLNAEGEYKPTPVLFISRPINSDETTVSMQYEGLPLEVFAWFLNEANSHWKIDLSKISAS